VGAPETLQARQAALLLHGLPPATRLQVIAKLNEAESKRLVPLLDELTELGVTQSLGERMKQLTPPAHSDGKRTAQERAELLGAESVALCLQSCSPATVALLIRSNDWPWREQVLGLIANQIEVRNLLRAHSTAIAPAVLTALCERLCLEADQLAAVHSPLDQFHRAPQREGLRRWIPWMR
jgi:hypothetical protein